MIPLVVGIVGILAGLVGIFLGVSARSSMQELIKDKGALTAKISDLTDKVAALEAQKGADVQGMIAQLRSEVARSLSGVSTNLETQRQSILALDQKIVKLGGGKVAAGIPATGSTVTAGTQTPAPGTTTGTPPQPSGEAKVYSVEKGDNLTRIAAKHGISLSDLEKANPGVDSKKLAVGQKLNIPAK